jgi:twinkle protein
VSRVIEKNQPCLSPSCGSSDARQVYEEGSSYCFSCKTYFPKAGNEGVEQSIQVKENVCDYPIRPIPDRKISSEVTRFYGVRSSFNVDSGEIDAHYYPYEGGFKRRGLPKTFSWLGKLEGLFGQALFPEGGKRLIICEGEIDTLSVAQASLTHYKKIYPVVGINSSSILKPLVEARDWVRTFDEVVLFFDNDEAGKKAVQDAASIVGIDKARVVSIARNDANEILVQDGYKTLMQRVWEAREYTPGGILNKEDLWTALEEYNSIESLDYPPCLAGVNLKTRGMRLGEITLFISGTGAGKSTLTREIMYNNLKTTDSSIGIVSLEEAPAETTRKLAALAIDRNPAAEEEPIPLEELRVGFDRVFGDDRALVLDHQGSINDSSIMDKLEYMALKGCQYLFIDHITILVSEGADNLTGLEAQDKVMNDLLRLVKKHNVWIGLISHLRKVPGGGGKTFEQGKLPSLDDIRGSGSIKQISFDVVAFARNMEAEEEEKRNHIKMSVLKCRYTGLTGPVEGAHYDFKTGRLLSESGEVSFEQVETPEESITPKVNFKVETEEFIPSSPKL